MARPLSSSLNEHPLDVMNAALHCHGVGEPFALAIITGTEGGAVRRPGAMMAIGQNGDTHGYLSGGCIDSDVAFRARAAIEAGTAVEIRYGADSPFMDIRLPCGGAIDLVILPAPDITTLTTAKALLEQRKHVAMRISSAAFEVVDSSELGADIFHYRPKLNLRIAGRGADPIALAQLAQASGINTEIWSPDDICLREARQFGLTAVRKLTSPNDLPAQADDDETAFVLMFHDNDWEPALLEEALSGDAFYVGAVGSQSTHDKRCDMLRARGLKGTDIARIRGPIGMIPSMRDASMLAVSTLAEIVDAFHTKGAQG